MTLLFYRDLAYQFRRKHGDWFRVIQILQSGAIATDVMQNEAWNELGDFYFDRQQWFVETDLQLSIKIIRILGQQPLNIMSRAETINGLLSVMFITKIS